MQVEPHLTRMEKLINFPSLVLPNVARKIKTLRATSSSDGFVLRAHASANPILLITSVLCLIILLTLDRAKS